MAKVKYDLSGVDELPDQEQAPVGIYRGKIEAAESKDSSQGNPMIEVRFRITHDAAGKKVKEDYAPVWYYPILEHDSAFVMNRTLEFLKALGVKMKGTIDTDKLVGESLQLKLGSDTDQDGDYRPKIKKVMALAEASEDEGEADEDGEDDDDEEEIDLAELDRKELKALIAEQELDITVKKKMTDDEIREAITELLGGDEEEEDEDEEEDDDEEEVDLTELDRKALKALIADNDLDIKVLKKHTDDEIRAAIEEALGGDDDDEEEEDEDEEDDDKPDYDKMQVSDLKKILKERELPTGGTKKVMVARLVKDDGDTPF